MDNLYQYHELWILAGFIALFYGAEWLVKGSADLALKFGISPLVVGLTVVAFGTSAPELLVCINANMTGNADQALGTVIGSNICNIALILGVGALIRPIVINRQIIRREVPILLVASVVFVLMLINKKITQWEGAVLVIGIVTYVVASLIQSRKESNAEESEDFSAEDIESARNMTGVGVMLSIAFILIGLVVLKFGSDWLVEHGAILAEDWGVSKAIIGLLLLAFGTSLPELATSIIAARKGQGDIITGNAVGSCIFNLLAVMGGTAVIQTIVAGEIKWVDMGVMLGIIIIVMPMMWSRKSLSRMEGVILLGMYLTYTISRFLMDQSV